MILTLDQEWALLTHIPILKSIVSPDFTRYNVEVSIINKEENRVRSKVKANWIPLKYLVLKWTYQKIQVQFLLSSKKEAKSFWMNCWK